MKLCLFPGSFNPVHRAHTELAKHVLDVNGFDKLLFIPTYVSPHKCFESDNSTHRFNMLNLAVSSLGDTVEVSDAEIKNKEVSYTYPTVVELTNFYKPDCRVSFIIGTDAFEQIGTWHEADKLKDLVEFLVFPRADDVDCEKFSYLTKLGYVYKIIDKKFEDISSTKIRKIASVNGDLSTMIDEKVWEYIRKNELYKL